jgi:flagellar hook protein FlgE
MPQGLYTATSGIRANQQRLDVISNNIANVNTIGFKSSTVNFATVFASTISGGTAPTGTSGGTNPLQVGSGVLVSDIASNFGQGGSQYTGRSTDLMLNGEGFFVVDQANQNIGQTSGNNFYLTRAGNFSLDSQGNLVTASGNRVRGTSQISGSSPNTNTQINIPQEMMIIKDLNASNQVVGITYAPVGTSMTIVNGRTPAAGAQVGADPDGAGPLPAPINQTVTAVKLSNFSVGRDGSITATYSNGDRITVRTNAATVNATNPVLARRQIVHMPAEGGTFAALNQTATDSGPVQQLANGGVTVFNSPNPGAENPLQGMQLQIQTATVVNPNGLLYDGNNNFLVGANSGNTNFGVAATENRGWLQGGALESSNVDLAGEFTNMIVTQRGLEASSRVIRAQSEVLQTIIQSAG